MTMRLSLILPAFNEAERLPPYLASIRRYLTDEFGPDYEVLVVDDGSRDGLAGVVADLAWGWPQLRALAHPVNRGKGAAVRTGLLAARGELLLFADADGATPIDQEARLRAAVEAGAAAAVGVRDSDDARRLALRRRLASGLFAALARKVVGVNVRDPQCGFMMFRRAVGWQLFGLGRETGYLFDLEALALADRLGHPVAEVPIAWADQPGSKVRLLRDGGRMLRDLVRLRRELPGRLAVGPARLPLGSPGFTPGYCPPAGVPGVSPLAIERPLNRKRQGSSHEIRVVFRPPLEGGGVARHNPSLTSVSAPGRPGAPGPLSFSFATDQRGALSHG
jgi:dolichyl-phosphate beta-glucosyltransferase